jgi:hypothetical protein
MTSKLIYRRASEREKKCIGNSTAKVLCNRQPTPKMVNDCGNMYRHVRGDAREGRRNFTAREREMYYYKIIKTGQKARKEK